MAWVFLVIGAVLVFAIAASFVGTESFRLGHETPAAIFDLDEAVQVVGEQLPEAAQSRLSFDEVRVLIRACLAHLSEEGVTALPGEDLAPPQAGDIVVDDDVVVAVVLAEVESQGLDVLDEDAAAVITRLLDHLGQIGALGPRAGSA